MSNIQECSALRGYKGPFFPGKSIVFLNDVYEHFIEGRGERLQRAVERIKSFKELVYDVKTCDGYDWYRGARFAVESLFGRSDGEVMVLFPWKQDFGRTGGTASDKSISVYTAGRVSSRKVRRILRKIGKELERRVNPGILEMWAGWVVK